MSGLSHWPRPADIAETRRRKAPKAPAAAPGAGPRKALYLDGRGEAIEVRLLGPALGISRGARRLSLPLERVARIIVCGRVDWDGRALAACLQHGLPVIFLDGRARPVGAAAPLTGRSSSLDELLADWVQRRHWREGFDNWLRAQRFRMLRHWARDRAARGKPVAAGDWREAVRSYVYLDGRELTGPNPGGCYAVVVSMLLRAGVRLQYRANDGGALALANELARLADCRLALGMGSLATLLVADEPTATRAVESGADDLGDYIADLLARLRRNLADRIEPCP